MFTFTKIILYIILFKPTMVHFCTGRMVLIYGKIIPTYANMRVTAINTAKHFKNWD